MLAELDVRCKGATLGMAKEWRAGEENAGADV
jgi:hypothetical protein